MIVIPNVIYQGRITPGDTSFVVDLLWTLHPSEIESYYGLDYYNKENQEIFKNDIKTWFEFLNDVKNEKKLKLTLELME